MVADIAINTVVGGETCQTFPHVWLVVSLSYLFLALRTSPRSDYGA